MKTSFAAFVVCGALYLYLLEDITNFVSGGLTLFQNSMATEPSDSKLSQQRTPTDTLLEKYGKGLTDSELEYLKQQVI
jgi:hypothetical protein